MMFVFVGVCRQCVSAGAEFFFVCTGSVPSLFFSIKWSFSKRKRSQRVPAKPARGRKRVQAKPERVSKRVEAKPERGSKCSERRVNVTLTVVNHMG